MFLECAKLNLNKSAVRHWTNIVYNNIPKFKNNLLKTKKQLKRVLFLNSSYHTSSEKDKNIYAPDRYRIQKIELC